MEETKEIQLTRGKVSLVDAADYEWLTRWRWRAVRYRRRHEEDVTWYAQRNKPTDGSSNETMMHRLILDAPRGVEVDHRDGDGLRNIRSNIRTATHQENRRNLQHRKRGKKSLYLGVSWYSPQSTWMVRIGTGEREPNGQPRTVTIGYFRDQREAALARDIASRHYFREFAALNFSEPGIPRHMPPKLRAILNVHPTWIEGEGAWKP